MTKRIYITTSIPYVNGDPHIGYAMEAIQADTLARYYRLSDNDTYFLTGTDENAIKNVEAAEKLKISPQELVDKLAQRFYDLKPLLNLSFDQFIRTTDEKHKLGSQKLWNLCKKDIYKKDYEGLYCVGCETFYKDGQFKDNICPEHNRKLELVVETNYFFALSKYKEQIKKLVESDTIKVFPEFRKNEVLQIINSDFEDFSVSRPATRTKGWGITVPDDETQKIYVWFDALINYITALDFATDGDLFKKYWLENPERYHVIGKSIVKFHAIYWIGMLLSAGLPIPTKIFTHGFINADGQKMSKSLGNVIDPFTVVNQYGTDAVRYYLLREIPPFDDGEYSDHRMRELYNSDLANELGNLMSRLTTIAEKDEISLPNRTEKIITNEEIIKAIEGFEFNKALEIIWNKVKQLNRDVNTFTPWAKTPDERYDFLVDALSKLYVIGLELLPFIPDTADKILIATNGKIHKITPLFPRIS